LRRRGERESPRVLEGKKNQRKLKTSSLLYLHGLFGKRSRRGDYTKEIKWKVSREGEALFNRHHS